MSDILIRGMEMPKDCPMCPLAHWDFTEEFRGCKIVYGKKYAMETEPGYPETNFRPDWCHLVPVPEHGDLIDKSGVEVLSWTEDPEKDFADGVLFVLDKLDELPVIIPADGEDYEVPADKGGDA